MGYRHGDMSVRRQIRDLMGCETYKFLDYDVSVDTKQSEGFMYFTTCLKWSGDFNDVANLPEVMDTATAVLVDYMAEYMKDKFPQQRIGWYPTMVQDNRALELGIKNNMLKRTNV